MKADSTKLIHNATDQPPAPRLTPAPPNDHPKRREKPPREAKPKPLKRTQADKRVDFLLQKHFDNDPDFRPLILELAENDPTPKKKYLAWLVKHWTGKWNPTDADLERVAQYLETHHKGAKYFSPLTWTGLLLEDAGYQADIFRYTPETLAPLGGRIAEIIRIAEEDKQIRQGDPVALARSEIVHQDNEFTIIRIRTTGALIKLSQGSSWCIKNGNLFGYSFPFDVVLDHEGNRYLANGKEVRDEWDRMPAWTLRNRINELRESVFDSHQLEEANRKERFATEIEAAIQEKKKLTRYQTEQILKEPNLALRYAMEAMDGPWRRFEKQVRVADLTASQAVDYAVKIRKKRWRKFENKIKRSVAPLEKYRRAFPGSIAFSDAEVFKLQLKEWRRRDQRAHWRPARWSNQWHAEALHRDYCYETSLLDRPYSFDRYCRLLASIATSSMAHRYRSKLKSYFDFTETEEKQAESQNRIAREMCRRFDRRVPFLETSIAKDPIASLNYAKVIGERFIRGEKAIMKDPKTARRYRRAFLGSSGVTKR